MNLPPRTLLAAAAVILSGGLAQAQVPLNGNIFDGSGGPLLSGTVYHANSISVPAGETLTVQAGAIVKFNTSGNSLTVNGTLDANGTSGSPAIFTSIEDDAAGGDTNANGAVAPAKGDWRGLSFVTADTSTLDWCEVRYGGSFNVPLVQLAGADIAMTNCTLRDGLADALDLSSNSFPTVSGCTFTGSNTAVDAVDIDAVPGFTNNSASGNAGNFILITVGAVSADATIAPANVLEGALVTANGLTVPAGRTLTLEAGVVLKASSVGVLWSVSGTLDVNGTSANPVILTSFGDDSAGGDTNNDGPSSGSAGEWRGVSFTNSDASTLDWCELRYGGAFATTVVFLNGSDASLSNCTIRDGLGDALSLNSNSFPSVRDTSFLNNGGRAVYAVRLDAVPGLSFNTATGNGVPGVGGNYIRVPTASINSNVRIDEHNVLEGALVIASGVATGTGGHLTLGPGVVLKLINGGFSFAAPDAQVTLDGTAARPVVITSFEDDTIAGDTNLDGSATVPAKGDWSSFSLTTGTATMRHALFRYGGAGNVATVFANFIVGFTADSVRVEHGQGTGFRLRTLVGATTDRLCSFDNSQGFVLEDGFFDLTRCTAVANGTGFNTATGFDGRIVSSIGWGNGINFGNTFPTLLFSNGSLNQAGSNGNIDTDPLFVDEAGGDLRLTVLSPCVDTGDPAGEQDPDCTRTDMGAHMFDQGAPSTYCTAKVNSQGCTPFVDFTGYASVTDTDAFTITGNDVLNNKNGLFFYGYTPHNGNFQGGTKCVLSPVKRTGITNSGGDPAPNNCSGTYSFAMNARIQSGVDAALIPGVDVYGQFWTRDPSAPFNTGLTDAIQFTVCP